MQRQEKIAAFDRIYYAKQRVVFAFIFGRIGCRATSEDLLQQVFMRVWRNIDELHFRSEANLQAWLFTVARNLATDHLRGASIATVPMNDDFSASQNIVLDLEQRAMIDQVGAVVASLDPDQRAAFTLTVLGEQTSDQAGEILGKPAGTIRYLVSQARERIRKELDI